MNQKSIGVIVGLMAIALLGIIALQAYWINERVQLEEAYFDKMVFDAMNRVQEIVELEGERIRSQTLWNPKHLDIIGRGETKGYNKPDELGDIGYNFLSEKHRFDSLGVMSGHDGTLNCSCPACRLERMEEYNRRADIEATKYRYNPPPIQERIIVDHLDENLRKQLQSRKINIDYTYGVYSTSDKQFVIRDGKFNYVASEDDDFGSQAVTIPDIDDVPAIDGGYLMDTPYSVPLFQRSSKLMPDGKLMVFFPGRTRYVWSSVWMTVLAAILFTGIILFCFIYTIQVILAQKKLSKMKTDFINNMTHEFKTPIATISLASDSINNPKIAGNKDKVMRFANIIKQENRRMNSQVEKVLQMALLDKNDFQLKLTQVNTHEVIQQAVRNIGLRVEKQGGTVTADLEAANSTIECDMTHFSNVINNLLDNAFKYSKEVPEISVSTQNVANGIQISVQDKGIGMTKEARKHIFDKFYRVHTGNLHDVKGFGLGLSYVKAILTAHKGQIDVNSELGKGSEFILTFPFHVNQ